MHSSRMPTSRSSSHLFGGGLPQCMLGYPLGVGMETPQGVGLETLQPDPSTSPLGVGLKTCKACWDTTPTWIPARHGGIPPAMHAEIPPHPHPHGWNAPWVWAWRCPPPPRVGMETPLGVGLETPQDVALETPQTRPLNFPLGVVLETCKACWDTTPTWIPSRHAGIPLAMHAGIPTHPSPTLVDRILDTRF